jgi:hypothetical protein
LWIGGYRTPQQEECRGEQDRKQYARNGGSLRRLQGRPSKGFAHGYFNGPNDPPPVPPARKVIIKTGFL